MVKNMKNTNNTRLGTYFYGDESYNFNFLTTLTASEKFTFVNSVLDALVEDNRYNSILRDMIFDYKLIQICTNVDTTFLKNSEDMLDSVEQFLSETNIVDIIKANMEVGLLEELNKAVDLSIRYRTGIHPNPIADSLASLLNTLEKKVDEFDMGSMMKMAQKFAGMNEELTPESIVDAYINSDTHKENIVEIEKVKKQKKEIAKNLDKAVKSVTKK